MPGTEPRWAPSATTLRTEPHAPLRDEPTPALTAAAALVAIVGPAALAFNQPPSATFLNQAVAIIGWGMLLAAIVGSLGRLQPSLDRIDRGGWSLLIALTLCAAGAFITLAVGHSTPALVLSSAGLIVAALLAAAVGLAVVQAGQAAHAFRALAIALVTAGVLSSLVSLVQVYLPSLPDGTLIAATAVEGRASGNLRQPNHLSSLLLWALIALAWLCERRVLSLRVGAALALLFVWVLVLSASRTAWVDMAVLAIWGAVDRSLSRRVRLGLLLVPVAYLLIWGGLSVWAAMTNHVFYGQTRVAAMNDISSSRYGIWANTLTLIARHPWFGVGWGDFNFAWSLTPFPGRPTAFFDHTHNIVLNFVVELGLPLGLAICGLFAHALWRSFRAARHGHGEHATLLRAALMIVLMMVIHSQLEYPLWYAYFLLPTAFAFGLTLASPTPQAASAATSSQRRDVLRPALVAACVLMAAGGVAAIADYQRVVVVFAPTEPAPSLEQRIADGRRSWFFAHHANYAAATTQQPVEALPALANSSHYLLDTRLMMAWAEGLAANGQVDKARFIAARLREFRNADAEEFFAPCNQPAAGAPPQFQCTPPTGVYDERDFR